MTLSPSFCPLGRRDQGYRKGGANNLGPLWPGKSRLRPSGLRPEAQRDATEREKTRCDARPHLKELGIAAVGTSPDQPAKQKKFDVKYVLGFPGFYP